MFSVAIVLVANAVWVVLATQRARSPRGCSDAEKMTEDIDEEVWALRFRES